MYKEAHKGIQSIIAIWRKLADDPEPSVRVLTLAATIIGFLALIAILTFRFLPDEIQVIVGIAFMICVVLFVAVALWIALRFSSRAPTKMLEAGFANISMQKYGST
ncbi:MAG: hypothetical protein V3T23_04915 [Nitrososphaerales archaeon]